MTLKEFRDALVEHHGSSRTDDFRYDWSVVVDYAKDKDKDVVTTRAYGGDNFMQHSVKETDLDSLLTHLKAEAESTTYSRPLRLDVKVSKNYTKEAMNKSLVDVVRIDRLPSNFIKFLPIEIRDAYFVPHTETITRWHVKTGMK